MRKLVHKSRMGTGSVENATGTNDWRWQIQNSIRKASALELHLELVDDERRGLAQLSAKELPLQITPHFLSLMDKKNPDCPLRMQMIPRASEFRDDPSLRRDPLGEQDHEVVPHLIHRYPDRVLLLITDRCASYCRFCTRKRWVGQGPSPRHEHLAQALDYIRNHEAIQDVIVSGGDGLLLSDENLRDVLSLIRAIPHVQIIRIATRMLAFAPTRVTPELTQVLKEFQPLYVMSHFNHSKEIAPKAVRAISQLIDAGVPVVNQTVLLKGVNDNQATLTDLFKILVRLRVRPYYLHQCDVVRGTAGLRVKLDDAVKLYSSLRGLISGLCLPTFVIDIPGGFGKVPIHQNPMQSRDDESVYLRGFDGEVAPYPLN